MAEKVKPVSKKPQPYVWLIEVETNFGLIPHAKFPRFIIYSEARDALADVVKNWPREVFNLARYRREED